MEDLDRPELVASFLRQLYMEREDVPPRILVPTEPADREVLETWLSGRRGSHVTIAVPARGAKRELMEVVGSNATDAFHRHKLRRASDFGARSRALSELADQLGLEQAPSGSSATTSPTSGRATRWDPWWSSRTASRSEPTTAGSRSRASPGQDDFASMEEMLTRRFSRLLKEKDEAPGGRRRFSYPPALVVVDGGRGQLSVATKVLEDLGLHIPHIGLAKRLEEIYFPDRPDPLSIARGSEALFVLQHIRDEAHRFAITYHRQRRDRRALSSPLDEIPGVGPSRKRALMKRFGSLTKIRQAEPAELAATPGVGPRLADEIHRRLHAVSVTDRRESA